LAQGSIGWRWRRRTITPELGGFYLAALGEGVKMFEAALKRWQADGLLPRTKDSLLTATLCLSMITNRTRILSVLGVPVPDADREAYVTAAVDIFLRGMGYTPPH
jgi:hypothetical protein